LVLVTYVPHKATKKLKEEVIPEFAKTLGNLFNPHVIDSVDSELRQVCFNSSANLLFYNNIPAETNEASNEEIGLC